MDPTDLIRSAFGENPPRRLGIAVSGGSDSVALLQLLADWRGAELHAVTVDHGLRAEAADEAAQVAAICARRGVPHQVLVWEGWEGQGNLMAEARRARYALMAEWAEMQGIGDIALGHTAQDQAETFLMRLARQAGIDGLSGMPAMREADGVRWWRPLLQAGRDELRDYLRSRGIAWAEDPTNEDEDYERVRARKVLAALGALDISAEGIAQSAANLATARDALARMTDEAAAMFVTTDQGDVIIRRTGFDDLPHEIRRRIIAGALRWVASAEYGPRGPALSGLLTAIAGDRDATLHGCLALVRHDQVRICREGAAVAETEAPAGALWDGRWIARRVRGTMEGFEVRALSAEGLRDCPDWRATGRPRASLIASPAIWKGARLVSAPLAGLAGGWALDFAPAEPDFRRFLISR